MTAMWGMACAVALAAGIEHGEATFRPTAREGSVPERFRLVEATFPFEIEQVRVTPRYTVHRLRFPSPIVTADEANNTVHAEYFRPEGGGKHPAAVVLHILGADFALSRYMAARLADRGVAALFVKLPYYGERRGPDGSKRFLSNDIGRSITAMGQGVCDVRRAAAWLASRPEVDPSRLGVTGISLGGIVSSIAASVDPAIGRAALLLAGGGLGEILWEMPEAARYKALWVASGRSKEELIALTAPLDPLTYAEGLRSKRVLMMAGTTDEVIPPLAARALWEKAGRPEIRWMECGHYSAAGFLLPAMREAVEFLAADDVASPKQPKVQPGPSEPDWLVLLDRLYGLRMFDDLLNPVTTTPEATPGRFRKAGPGPVRYRPVLALGLEVPIRGGYYAGEAGDQELWSYQHKTTAREIEAGGDLNPPLRAGSSIEFDPGDAPFGLWVGNDQFRDKVWTEPLRVAKENRRLAAQPYKAMIYPVRDRATGKVIPNSYLIGWEYSTNDDFQDVVCRIDNVVLVR